MIKNLTYSEMCTKRSSPPIVGVTKPWPFSRQNDLIIPVSKGFPRALSDLKNVYHYLIYNTIYNARAMWTGEAFIKYINTYVEAVRFLRVIMGLGICKCEPVLLGESSLLKPYSLDMIKIIKQLLAKKKQTNKSDFTTRNQQQENKISQSFLMLAVHTAHAVSQCVSQGQKCCYQLLK